MQEREQRRGKNGEPPGGLMSLLDTMLDSALGLVGGQRGSIMLLDGAGRVLRIRHARGLPDDVVRNTKVAPGEGVAGRVLVEGQPVHMQGSREDGLPLDESLIMPLTTGRGVVGTLNLSRKGGREWGDELRDTAISFSRSVSQILEVERVGSERDERINEQDRVLAFSRIFGSTRELSKILELLLSCARELTGCESSFATVFEPSGRKYHSWAGHNLDGGLLEQAIEDLKDCSGHDFFSQAEPEYHEDLDVLPSGHPLRLLADHALARSCMVVPLVFGYRILGRLYLLNVEYPRMHQRTFRLLILLSQEATIAIDQARAMRELQQLAFIDPLTQVYNRTYWVQRFEEELVRSERRSQPLSLLMIDIDHFKVYNDTYGHLVGDEVLKMVSQVIRACLREVDVVGRFGGEEFAVLLPDTDEQGANYVAERIRLMVERLDLGRTGGGVGRLTVSTGLATCHGRKHTVEEVIRRADTALFVSKEGGRNRVSIYSPQGVKPSTSTGDTPPEDTADRERLSSSSEFLFRMADSLGGAREQRPLSSKLGFHILLAGGADGEHLALAGLFDGMGYKTLLSHDGNKALSATRTLSPDLVILDLELEGIQSLELLKRLKERDPLLPVIVITVVDEIQSAVEAIRLGADDYIVKPYGAEEIRQCVEKAFTKRFRLLSGEPAGEARESSIHDELERVSREVRREFVRSARDLRIMQEFNRRSIEHPTRGAVMVDSQLKVVQINRLAAEMLDLDEDRCLGRGIFNAVPILDNPRLSNALTHVEQTGEPVTINDIWLKYAGAESSALHKLSILPARLEEGEHYVMILLENMIDRRILAEEHRRLRMRVAKDIFGRIAQHLQVISGRGELLLHGARPDERSIRQVIEGVREITRILSELGADLPADTAVEDRPETPSGTP